MKKLVIIFVILVVLVSCGAFVAYKMANGGLFSSKQEENVDTRTDSEKIRDASVDMETQRLVAALNQSIKANYMTFTDFKTYQNFLTYTDKSVKFFSLAVAYDMSPDAQADYDIRIERGSNSPAEYAAKSDMYKEKTRRLMDQYFRANRYDKLKNKGIIGTIGYDEKTKQTTIKFLGDYLYEKYSTNKNLVADDVAKLRLIQEYLNFSGIYFTKNEEDISKIFQEVRVKMQDPEFEKLASAIDAYFFSK